MTTFIWIVLVILTIFAFFLGWFKLISSVLVAVLLFSTFLKGQLVIDYFMGLKDISLKYRIIPTIWLSVIIVLIGIFYYFPKSV